jgi:hypothetical protein
LAGFGGWCKAGAVAAACQVMGDASPGGAIIKTAY